MSSSWRNAEIAPSPDGNRDSYRDAAAKLPAKVPESSSGLGTKVIGANTDDDRKPPYGTVDRFLIFREIHNMPPPQLAARDAGDRAQPAQAR